MNYILNNYYQMSTSIERGNKIVLLGEPAVGKSALAIRMVRNQFYENYESTIGAAYFNITIDKVKLDIWDTAGQERYISLAPMYYRNAKVILLVFDVTNLDSLDRLVGYIENFIRNNMKNYGCIIVGNKVDLVDEYILEKRMSIITGKFEQFAQQLPKPIEYIFTSAKDDKNIIELKNKIVGMCKDFQTDDYINSINLGDISKSKSYCSC
jgi:Ras-related protein Rab-5C